MFSNSKIKWYDYYNNDTADKNMVLMRSEYILKNDLLIARRRYAKSYQFAKLNSIDEFIHLFNNTASELCTYHAVLTNTLRYLYFDVDIKLTKPLHKYDKVQLILVICNVLNKFNSHYHIRFNIPRYAHNWLIWDATRIEKFSLHIINTDIIMDYKMQHNYCTHINQWIKNNDKLQKFKINVDEVFDDNVYSANYQLWRLPENHNGNIHSKLTLYNKSMTLKEQFISNFMINITKSDSYKKHCSNHSTTSKPAVHIQSIKILNIQKSNVQKLRVHNLPLLPINIQNKLYLIFGNGFMLSKMHDNKNTNINYRIKNHYCPIAKRVHLSNTAKIVLCNTSKKDMFFAYIRYYCMDEDCYNKGKYYSLSKCLLYPWIFDCMNHLESAIIQDIDVKIQQLFKMNILEICDESKKYFILKNKKLQFNTDSIIVSTFFENHIYHTICKKSNISMCYRSTKHKYANYGLFCCYCKTCDDYLN